jgi:hypothetical protein
MKKLVPSNPVAPRTLTMRRETIRVLRQLALHELRDPRFAGGSNPVCDGSTFQPWTAMCD